MNLRQRIIYIVVSYPFIVYAIAYIAVCLDPYWYDPYPLREYIPQSDRWAWALVLSWFYIFWGLPLLLAVIALMFYLSRR
ncbi:MAG: hypothetical protein ACRC62_37810 [Microcoleus sp.]